MPVESFVVCIVAWQNSTRCRDGSLVPRPTPFFCSSVCVQYNTRRQKSAKNGEGLGTRL